jgi:hypothetical protein
MPIVSINLDRVQAVAFPPPPKPSPIGPLHDGAGEQMVGQGAGVTLVCVEEGETRLIHVCTGVFITTARGIYRTSISRLTNWFEVRSFASFLSENY